MQDYENARDTCTCTDDSKTVIKVATKIVVKVAVKVAAKEKVCVRYGALTPFNIPLKNRPDIGLD